MATPAFSSEISDATPTDAAISAPVHTTYREILKSSAVIGGASILNVVIGIVRTKVMAVLLGPAGVGLMGLYSTIADLARSVASLGINGSGVRQIAEAVGTKDLARIARTVTVLRRTTVLLGIAGAVLLAILSGPVSTFTFGTDRHASAVVLLSLAVFFRRVADGQGALIQGMRRIGDLARMAVLGALWGTMASIAIVYVLQQDGIVPSLVAVSAMSAVTSWWYSRQVRIEPDTTSAREKRQEVGALLKLGVGFMASGFLMLWAAYTTRMFVLWNVSLEATGLYEAAWTLGGLYVGFVLQAMGTDFYPRLVAAINDNDKCNRLVNEQTHVSMLLAAPGVIATLTLAPLVITLFYSERFGEAVDVLRWICLGVALRVISWPMGYIIVAKGRPVLFFAVELAWTLVNIGLAWICVKSFGLAGAGMAFFGSYVFHAVLIYPIVRVLTGFRWSSSNIGTGLLFLLPTGFVFIGLCTLPSAVGTSLGLLATVAFAAWSTKSLAVLVDHPIPPRLSRVLVRYRRTR